MRLDTRVARLERERGETGCALCAGEPGIRFVLDHDGQSEPEPAACAGCGREALVIRIGAAVLPTRSDADRLPA